ncbi:transglycosylase domain-containing protein [Blastococcus tunisiensis]|uniref:Monofunctional biosynthetic peptidoglycan transglycosylase n=1 Tax=Blastococcus tunisiensis TaxID=1798228 RepID=A0A1I2B7P5_9ACTN|nr:transglycosylase domain-containing protein [Blastococcus sp. DSM 46838]SFE51170.1 monofunctional biosynthetic peptidoglycan transglycosylase [Blastococcus sp. DSM 46838]
MASSEPGSRTTRWLRRRTEDPPTTPQQRYDEQPRYDEQRPRFDRPPPAGNDWYGAPPSGYSGAPPAQGPAYPWPPAPERPQPPGRPYPPEQRPYPPAEGPYPSPRGRRGRRDRRDAAGRRPRRGLLRRAVRVLAVVVVVQALLILSLRWVDPPTTAFMAANPDGAIQDSVPVEHVSRNFLAAVIAHEDSQLPYRSGAFEWDALWSRAYAHLGGEEDPSGSTIPQQVAKNLFLNQELSAWRKGLEAALSSEMALLIDDRRMLELYVNYAQFGPTIYGVCAAGWYYFDSPPAELTQAQAVQLVGLLPSPGHVQRAPGGGMDFEVDDGLGWLSRSHVINAQNRVPAWIDRLGFQPVEDAGVTGLASEQEPSGDDCTSPPEEVTELIAAEGTA